MEFAKMFHDVSPLSVYVSMSIFMFFILFLFLPGKKSKLEERTRKIARSISSTDDEHRESIYRRLMRELTGELPLDEVRRKAADWLASQTIIGPHHKLLMTQAGLRQSQAMLYFEVIRILCGIVCGVLAYLTLDIYGNYSDRSIIVFSFVVLGFLIGLYLPGRYLKRRAKKRKEMFDKYWDDAIGLLVICLDAGLSIEVAMRRIARELVATAPVLAEEIIITVTELTLLRERRLAYLRLSQRMDLASVKSVTIALIQAEKQGASISRSLRVISQTNRQTRISLAEEKAAALGPKMTLPMVIFFLPVIFVIILAPVILNSDFL